MRADKLVLGLLGLALSLLAACTTVPSSVAESIASARTADDHRKIADYFAQKAAEYDAEAALHEKMLRSTTVRLNNE